MDKEDVETAVMIRGLNLIVCVQLGQIITGPEFPALLSKFIQHYNKILDVHLYYKSSLFVFIVHIVTVL